MTKKGHIILHRHKPLRHHFKKNTTFSRNDKPPLMLVSPHQTDKLRKFKVSAVFRHSMKVDLPFNIDIFLSPFFGGMGMDNAMGRKRPAFFLAWYGSTKKDAIIFSKGGDIPRKKSPYIMICCGFFRHAISGNSLGISASIS